MHPLLDIVRPLAEQASARLIELRKHPLTQERKADRSWVTNADFEADKIIREGIRRALPDHSILTEETSLQGVADAEYLWMVDPLDGTRSYMRGTPGYSVMVGLLRHGRPYAGVVVDPVEGRTYEALQGLGAFETHAGHRRRLTVSTRARWEDMPVATSTGFPAPLQNQLVQQWTGPWLPPINSVGIKVGLLVRQVADIYMNHHGVHYWDTCAPQIILEEAGGRFTYGDGSPLNYALDGQYLHQGWTLASNNTRHPDVLRVAQAALPVTPPSRLQGH